MSETGIARPTDSPQPHKRFYVYALCYPDGVPFYIGKGTARRLHHHERAAKANSPMAQCRVIREIWEAGDTVRTVILHETDDEGEAYAFERAEIEKLAGVGRLVNARITGDYVGTLRLVLTVTDEEFELVAGEATRRGLSRAAYVRACLDLDPPRPAGAPAGNRNNPHGRKGRPTDARS